MAQQLPSFDGRGNTGAYCRYRIEDRSFFSIIKRDIANQAKILGFSAEKIGKLQIVAAEMALNLLKFGERNREFLWKAFQYKGEAGIEILTLDKGPGIRSISQAMEDGFSTSGTAGEGLGAIQRQSDFLEIYSIPGQGTVVLSRIFVNANFPQKDQPFNIAALSVAKPNETLCGDGYFIDYRPEKEVFKILLLDGLGHGPGAHEAAQAAIEIYAGLTDCSPQQALKEIHEQIKRTRGAVGMALKFNFKNDMLSCCGVGNIAGKLMGYTSVKHFPSSNGIIGHVMSSRNQDQEIQWEKNHLLVLHSDGLISRWDLSKYLQVQKYDPAILAACLYRDYNRGNDDTSIIISKYPSIDESRAKANN